MRVYPFIGGLPAIPGRFYPHSEVLCLYWREPASNCVRLTAAGSGLLAPLASLPLRTRAPTTPVRVTRGGRVWRAADGNVFAALELAFERRSRAVRRRPSRRIELGVRWRGPEARMRPRLVTLTPAGLYYRRRLRPLPAGVWRYTALNSSIRLSALDR